MTETNQAVRGNSAIVIGAGVIGASVALELQRSGWRVTVLDKGGSVGGGSTSGSASVVRFTYSTLDGVIASREAMHRWMDWEDHLGHVEGPTCKFLQVGMLTLNKPGTDQTAMLENFDRVGVPYEQLTPERFAQKFPMMDIGSYWPPRMPSDPSFFDESESFTSALFMPDSGFIDDPQLAAANLMDAARHHGTNVRLRSEVVEIRRHNGRAVGVTLASGEQLDSDIVVNVAGPWSRTVNEMAGVTADMAITTHALQRDIGSTKAPEGYTVDTSGVVMVDLDLGTFSRPQPGGSFLAGGVESPCDTMIWVDDPDQTSPNVDPEMWEAVMYRIARRIPSLEIPHRPTGLADHYDVTQDWIPIYDRSNLDGYYMAVGTSGNQFKNAPLVGEIMRDLITAVESGHDHDADPVQFLCKALGMTINLGHFSRRRERLETSNSVMG